MFEKFVESSNLEDALNRHNEKTSKIASEIIELYRDDDIKLTLEKGVNHTVPGAKRGKESAKKLDITDLNEIIFIDAKNKECIAESGVTFSKLVKETLKYGLIPMCVSELKDITIGGAVSGCSVESMSYKYGGFHDSCLEYEIISGTGEIIMCSRDNNADIFEMIHGSFGTLGILSLIKFRLIPAKPYVRVEYLRFNTMIEFISAINKYRTPEFADTIDFMDGIIHSQNIMVLALGKMIDEVPYYNTYSYRIYFKSTLKRKRDYIPIYDYFFRYDADCHWSTKNYGLTNDFLRFLLGPIAGSFVLGSKNILNLAKLPLFKTISPQKNGPDVIVDVFIPISKMQEFYMWYLKEFNYYPVWIVPYYMKKIYGFVNPDFIKDSGDNFYIDFAIYGYKQPSDGKNYYKILEDKVKELHGIKTLISHNYYSEKDFWEIHNKKLYNKVKNIMDPKNIFRDLYTKMVRAGS
ncbi:MAG: FAD-binding oxidoreductase [Promethearchaeota archaeon]